jgi:PAS domain S-box-containing protein
MLPLQQPPAKLADFVHPDIVAAAEEVPASILLVDDRNENLLALEAILQPLQQNLVRARSGEEALWHLLRTEFAVILMDVQMPGMDGFETVSVIKARERTRHVPIIFLTAISKEDRYVSRGYTSGAVDYIFKPVNPEILLSKVSVFVELWQKREQVRRQAEQLREIELRERQRELDELERQFERRHMAVLAESEARLSRFKSTLDATLDSVFIFSHDDLRFSYVNQGGIAQLGYTYEQLMQMTPLDVQSQYDEPQYRDMIGPLLRGEQTSLTFETVHRNRDGKTIPVETFLQFVVAEGEARDKGRFVAIVRDITERKRTEAALIEAKEEAERERERADAARLHAERANKAKSEFISSVSHELRTPLNAIIGFSKLMLNPRVGPLNEDQDAYTRDIVQSAEHLLQLINDILDLSKIEAGKLTLELSEFHLHELLKNSLTIVRESANRKNLQLVTDMPETLRALPPIVADERKLRQILYNLLSNAVKFTPEGGRVVLRADLQPEAKHPTVIISVEDNGIGIAPENQARIFGAFEQVDSSYARQQQGTGLGLALTKRLVELHNGEIWLSSEAGKGSTFFFSLSLEAPDVVAPEMEIPASEVSAAGQETSQQSTLEPDVLGQSTLPATPDAVSTQDSVAQESVRVNTKRVVKTRSRQGMENAHNGNGIKKATTSPKR